MSTRTIIEINHDYLGDYERHPELWKHLISKLGTGLWNEDETRGLWSTPGIRKLGQRHHTEPIKLEVK